MGDPFVLLRSGTIVVTPLRLLASEAVEYERGLTSPVDDEPVAVERVVAREYRVGVSDGAALRGGGMLATTRSVRSSWSAVSTSRRLEDQLGAFCRLLGASGTTGSTILSGFATTRSSISVSFGVGVHAGGENYDTRSLWLDVSTYCKRSSSRIACASGRSSEIFTSTSLEANNAKA